MNASQAKSAAAAPPRALAAPPDSVIVEFLGLPGVGKSALSHHVAHSLANRGVPVLEPCFGLVHGVSRFKRIGRKSVHVLREVLLHPIAALRAVRVIASSRQRSWVALVKLEFNWLLMVSLARNANRERGVHIFDEGLVQAVWSIALEGDVETALGLLEQLPDGVEFPNFLAIVEASLSTVDHRLRARKDGASRLDRKPELLAGSSELIDRIRRSISSSALAEDQARLVLLWNDAPDDVERPVAELSALIEEAAHQLGLVDSRPPAA